MDYTTAQHERTYDRIYGDRDISRWGFHDSDDPLVRYLRDRRLRRALTRLKAVLGRETTTWSALVVCGGVGGEGTFLANQGWSNVTVGDFAAAALGRCQDRDPRLHTLRLNTECLDLADESFDLVLVQDGLHELRRPVLGLTEMLRVARRAVIIIEPHTGVVARLAGTTWEDHRGEVNYVFRWHRRRFEDVVKSYLVRSAYHIDTVRLWDHNLVMGRIATAAGGGAMGRRVAQLGYWTLDTLAARLGNMFIGVVVKGEP